jgi:type II secretory pathway predicted ATPase ExeA
MYQQYFGLTGEPFGAALPPDKLFQSSGFKELVGRFQHVVTHRGIFLLTGLPGTGKTSALRYLLSTLSPKTHFSVYLPLSTVSVPEFYRQINRAIGGEDRYFKSDTYRAIQEQILAFATAKNVVPVIVLDEAHLLKEQNFRELQIIINFKMDSVMPLVLVLAGHSNLGKRLQSPNLESFHQRITLKGVLGPLSEEESAEFVRHHLKCVGAETTLLSHGAIKVAYQVSFGLPRVIGQIIRKSLISCANRGEKVVSEEDILAASKEVLH